MSALPAFSGGESVVPDYLLIGHVTRDVVDDGFVIGGTVTYAGLTAMALGKTVAVVSSVGPEVDLDRSLPGIRFRLRHAAATTTFENVYHNGHRQQWIRAVAEKLDRDLVPPSWRKSPIVHLAPLVGEFGIEMLDGFANAKIRGLTPQGWLRTWDADGHVRRSPWKDPEDALAACDAVVLSEEDVEGDWDTLRYYASIATLLVVTQGVNGCIVFERGRPWQVPAFPVAEVDATGAGDVFAAAFFIGLLEHGAPVIAAHYANCVASFAVEALGTSNIPSPAMVADRLATVPAPASVE